MNQIKTTLLLTMLTVLLVAMGGAIGGKTGMIIAFLIAGGMNFFAYWNSDKIVLKMYNAREVTRAESPDFYGIVENLARKANMPMPKVYVIPSDTPNAFATGRNPQNAVVAVTEGLVRLLPLAEVKAVMGHELGHIAHRDILIQSVAAVLASAVMMLAHMMQWAALFGMGGRDNEERGNPLAALAVALFAPFAATLIQMAISRSREFLADAAGAEFSGQPLDLAQALARLHNASRELPMQANPATENMFIVSPFSGRRIGNWFSTHPPVEERIARLREMAGR